MLAIPLPFVASLLFVIIAILLLSRQPSEGRLPALFILICSLSTAVVGLRWTFDLAILRFIQPIIASFLPVTAWICFTRAHRTRAVSKWHWAGPVTVLICASGYQLWLALTDVLLTMLYLGYGMALIRASFREPEEVRLTDITRVVVAERTAGAMLLMSACIDGALSLDFLMYAGEHASGILSLSYLIFIPAIVVAVVTLGVSTPQSASEIKEGEEKAGSADTASTVTEQTARLSEADAKDIVSRVDTLMKDKEAFLDPDLTLSRLAKKVAIPARQISMAINQIYGQNISKVLNGYRIEHAQMLLLNSEDSITDIYLRSGFQTKSNFNREFMRVSGQTPSAFRRAATVSCQRE